MASSSSSRKKEGSSSSKSKSKSRSSSSSSKRDKKEKGSSDADENKQLQQQQDLGPADPFFEHGRAFTRYCDPGTGTMSQDQFAAMLRDLRVTLPSVPAASGAATLLDPRLQFEAGMLFEQYDADKTGRISKEAFQRIFQEHLGRSGASAPTPQPNLGAPSLPGSRSVRFAEHVGSSDEASASRTYGSMSSKSGGGSGASGTEPTAHSYKSPLPQLSALPAEYGDSATALLRRDFLHLQTLLEATLAPRIEAEVHMLEQVHLAKREIRQRAAKVESATRAEAEAMIERLHDAEQARCKELERVANKHRKVLEKISQFQFLAAGPRPRDALRMDPFASSHYSSAMSIGLAGPAELDSSEDPSLAGFRRQRERAQAAFREQERFPHPVVMRDFVNLFKEFQNAAQKLIDAPYAAVAGVARPSDDIDEDSEASGLDRVRRILEDKACLPDEMADKKARADETAKLREQLRLKDQMIFTLVQEREGFEQQKQDFLKEVDDLSAASTEEIRAWASLHESSMREMNEKLAALQEENRRLRRDAGASPPQQQP